MTDDGGFGPLHPPPRAMTDRAASSLTPREREIDARVRSGESTKDIARALDLSPRTVEVHRLNISRKLGVCGATFLTLREREALDAMASGERRKDLARRLGISIKTVDSHVASARARVAAVGLMEGCAQ